MASATDLATGFVIYVVKTAALRVQTMVNDTFLSTNSTFSLLSLASALSIAAGFIVWTRLRRRGRISLRLLLRALRPAPAVLGASGKADLGFLLLNTLAASGLIGWALLSQVQVSDWTVKVLTHLLGAPTIRQDGLLQATGASVTLFLAYELAYWFDHWLSHRVPWLWEIHKVHHTAEGLSPLTNFRVHPLESLKFVNIAALVTGAALGLQSYALGHLPSRLEVLHADALFLAFTLTIAHLQHSHVWICFRGVWGRIFMSPAHHQIHHSTNPRHFGRNLGSGLAIWDLAFGTLYIPSAQREQLTFGVAGETEAAHSISGSLIAPMAQAVRVLLRRPQMAPGRPEASDAARLA